MIKIDLYLEIISIVFKAELSFTKQTVGLESIEWDSDPWDQQKKVKAENKQKVHLPMITNYISAVNLISTHGERRVLCFCRLLLFLWQINSLNSGFLLNILFIILILLSTLLALFLRKLATGRGDFIDGFNNNIGYRLWSSSKCFMLLLLFDFLFNRAAAQKGT